MRAVDGDGDEDGRRTRCAINKRNAVIASRLVKVTFEVKVNKVNGMIRWANWDLGSGTEERKSGRTEERKPRRMRAILIHDAM